MNISKLQIAMFLLGLVVGNILANLLMRWLGWV